MLNDIVAPAKGGISMNTNLAYQDEPRTELIDGQVVAMSPRPAFNHNQIASHIYALFDHYLKGKTCTAIADGTDLYLVKGKERFIPDVMVVCDRSKLKRDGVHGAPDLAVEVLSPSTSKRDRKHKQAVYAHCGVREYWIVSPGDRSIEQYFLEDGNLNLQEIYTYYPESELMEMDEEDRADIATHFKCSLFDDLDVYLSDIFRDLLPN